MALKACSWLEYGISNPEWTATKGVDMLKHCLRNLQLCGKNDKIEC